jgi:hypothetical protein
MKCLYFRAGRWMDVDFEELLLHVRRAVVGGGFAENRRSTKRGSVGCPNRQITFFMEAGLCVPCSWRLGFCFTCDEWHAAVLAGRSMVLLRKRILKRLGVAKQVSFHTFRHTVGTLLNANGGNPKFARERLPSLRVTTDAYMQAMGLQKRRFKSNWCEWLLKHPARRITYQDSSS